MGGAPATPALLRLVGSFDGSRHVVAQLQIGSRIAAKSQPQQPSVTSPRWFQRLAAPGLGPVDLPAGHGATLRLTPVAASEIGERWSEARRLLALLGLFSGLAAGLCFATAAWSLRPLGALVQAFRLLQDGQHGIAVAEAGPPEIAALATSFNRMERALSRAGVENRRLSAQLARLAEEERTELARDLHDEVGPLLFAITAWAAAARMQAQRGDPIAAAACVLSLEGAAAELQQAIRALLRRLRDSAPASIDLTSSLQELVTFWRGIRPETAFELLIDGTADATAEPVRAALFRVAQEAVSNAIRHGDPAQVRIALCSRGSGFELSIEDDGNGGDAGTGYGLVGMEERLQALGGSLDIRRARGWQVTAWAPADQPANA